MKSEELVFLLNLKWKQSRAVNELSNCFTIPISHRLMKSYQITKVSKLYDAEIEDQLFPSSQNEEPSCSTITSKTSPVTSSTSANAAKNSTPVVSSSEMGSQVHVPVTSSTEVKATSELPVSVHRVSSTSGDLDEPDSKGQAQSSDDLFDTEVTQERLNFIKYLFPLLK